MKDKVNSKNIDIAIDEFLDFCKPKDGWSKEIDKQFEENARFIYNELCELKKKSAT